MTNRNAAIVDYELADVGTRFIASVHRRHHLSASSPGCCSRACSAAGGIASFIFGVIYQWYFLTQQNGQTPGKRLMGIRVDQGRTARRCKPPT